MAAPHLLLVSLFEDTIVLGLVALTLDLPEWAAAVSGALVLAVSFRAPSDIRAFAFAVRLAVGRVFQTLTRRRWLGPDELPEWVRAVLENDDVLAPGVACRGSPVAPPSSRARTVPRTSRRPCRPVNGCCCASTRRTSPDEAVR